MNIIMYHKKTPLKEVLKTFLPLCLFILLPVKAQAQCTFRNTAFNGGEFLSYNLYYNWKFVWVKAGTASMYTVKSKYKGEDAFRASLTTRGNKNVDQMFVLRDTLLCYSSDKLEPLYFRKGAREGSRYTVDEVWHTYPNGQTQLRQHRQNHEGKHEWYTRNMNECVYDMMNIFLRARSFDPVGWTKGHVVKFPIADGNSIEKAQLRYRGKSTIKADNGVKYRCPELSYMEYDNDDAKYREIVRFYVTDDANHIPIRLDMFLRFGSAKAFLTNLKGTRSPITSVVK